MDRRRLADVRAGTADQQLSSGSGYMVGRRLVLTCHHVTFDTQGQQWPRLEVRLGHPAYGPSQRVAAEVAWSHSDKDVALLRIADEPAAAMPPVRWGWLVGPSPVPYTGLGYPEFADYESGRGVEQLAGTLPPLGVGADGGLVLDQDTGPEITAGRAWPGISGAAVFCHGLLTAVVTKDDLQFGNRRLHAVPVSALSSEPRFAELVAEDTGTAFAPEAVELVDFLQPPANAVLARTPGSLLAASAEAVEFTGRGGESAELTAWRDGEAGFAVMLVTGEGGQGKTRLARRTAADSRRDGWAAGFLATHRLGPMRGHSGQAQEVIELAQRLREATRPILLVVDYAETRTDEIVAFIGLMTDSPVAHPIRLLLLSRSAEAWWTLLTEAYDPGIIRTDQPATTGRAWPGPA